MFLKAFAAFFKITASVFLLLVKVCHCVDSNLATQFFTSTHLICISDEKSIQCFAAKHKTASPIIPQSRVTWCKGRHFFRLINNNSKTISMRTCLDLGPFYISYRKFAKRILIVSMVTGQYHVLQYFIFSSNWGKVRQE